MAATYTGNTGHEGCLDEMFAARAAGRESDTSYTDNIRSLAMCHARHRQCPPRRPDRDPRPARVIRGHSVRGSSLHHVQRTRFQLVPAHIAILDPIKNATVVP